MSAILSAISLHRRDVSAMNDAQYLFQDCADPAMSDQFIRALVALAHSENLWISRDDSGSQWLIDGPSQSIAMAYGATYEQWRRALLRAAGIEGDIAL